jgi:hypothetical protein
VTLKLFVLVVLALAAGGYVLFDAITHRKDDHDAR